MDVVNDVVREIVLFGKGRRYCGYRRGKDRQYHKCTIHS